MTKAARIELSHGSGGRKTQELIKNVFMKNFQNSILSSMLDAAQLNVNGLNFAFSTDSFVVQPIFFAGGDIGKLAVLGTVNDLAVSGANPLFLSVGLILEEGLLLEDLEKITYSMAAAAKEAGVQIVTGDTKVVEKGAADKIFINTAGIGVVSPDVYMHPANVRPGDKIIVSGTLGEHGLMLKCIRQGIEIDSPIKSDCANLLPLTKVLLSFGEHIRCMRDITRGGLATTLNELAEQSGLTFKIVEKNLPVAAGVRGAANMFGIDPLYLGSEGKLTAIVAPCAAEAVVEKLRTFEIGQDAAIIGSVQREVPKMVVIKTLLGGERILPMLEGDPLPRLC